MNCKNFTESPGKARRYAEDCATSIMQLDLERGVGRTHRYLTDPASHVKHAFGYGTPPRWRALSPLVLP